VSDAASPAPERPRRLDVVETVWQTAALSLRRNLRGGRLLVALAIVALPLLASLPVAHYAKPIRQERFFYGMVGFYHFGIAVPAVAMTFATAFPWPEANEGTLTYWFTAPVRRWAVHLGRFLAAAVVGLAALPLGVVAIGAPLEPPASAELRDVMVSSVSATLLAYPAYLALFWLVATPMRHGLWFGVLFMVMENAAALVKGNIAKATLIHYVRSTIHPAVPKSSRFQAEKLLQLGDPATPPEAVLAFVLVTVVALVLSLLLVEWIEYRGKTSQAT
jgi:hypothetical protein